ASHGLEDDVFRIVPLPLPTGGVLAISQNSVTYLKEHGSSFTQALNLAGMPVDPEEEGRTTAIRNETKLDILLANCSAVVLSPTVILFSIHPTGRLYLAHLVLTGRDVVTDIVWTSPGQHAPAWELHSWGEEFVCLVDTVGSLSVLKTTVSKKKLPSTLQPLKRPRLHQPGDLPIQSQKLKELLSVHEQLRDVYRFLRSYTFDVADTLPTLGPLQCMQPWISEGEDS
ncbi:paa-3, partial [Symbiodinium pilosum]